MYICKVIPVSGKIPINYDCSFCQESGGNEEIKKYNQDQAQSYVSDKICKFAYKLTLIHKFDKGNSLAELRKYKHKKTGKSWKPPQSFVYVDSYRGLVEDIIVGKVY
jgi:hypothetical protein